MFTTKTWENRVIRSRHTQIALDIRPRCWLRVLKLTRLRLVNFEHPQSTSRSNIQSYLIMTRWITLHYTVKVCTESLYLLFYKHDKNQLKSHEIVNMTSEYLTFYQFCCVHSIYLNVSSGGNKVSMLTHTYPNKHLRKIKVTICNHQDGSSLYVWPNVWSGDLKVEKSMVILDTKCPYWDQVSLKQRKPNPTLPQSICKRKM